MRLWLRGPVLQALRRVRGTCGSQGQPPPLPVSPKIVATWEAISLGRQPVPEYFNFAHDVLDVWSQLEKVKLTASRGPSWASASALGHPGENQGYETWGASDLWQVLECKSLACKS